VLRVLSALTALPAFWVTGVPGPVVAVAGTSIMLTIVGVVLTLAGLRRPVPASA
jgi:predicted phage tail protein